MIFYLVQIKIRKCERKLHRRDLELLMENAGIDISAKEKKGKGNASGEKKRKKKKGYRDSDDNDSDSQEDNFIASSTEESEDEKICQVVQKKIRKYVEKSGEWPRRSVFFGRAIFLTMRSLLRRNLADQAGGRAAAGEIRQRGFHGH